MTVGMGKEGFCRPYRLCKSTSTVDTPEDVRRLCPQVSIAHWLCSVDSWVSRNRCTNLSTTDSYNGTVRISSWTCNGVLGALEHYREDDMGHVWASQQQTFSQLVIGEGPTKLEANDVIMKFFDRFSLDKESINTASSTFTAASSVLLPVTQATGAGSPSTGTPATGTGYPSPTGTNSGPSSASPTVSGSSAAGGNSGVGLFGLRNSVGAIALALLWL
jgi:hypothetical protein